MGSQSQTRLTNCHFHFQVLELQLQHQSFWWIFWVDFLQNWLVWSPCCPRESQEFSPAPQLESINSSVLSILYLSISFSRGSSRPRDWTCISCIGKQILYHWATWEAHRSAKLLRSYIKYHLCMMFLSSLFCSIARLSIPAQIPHHFLFRCFKISFAIQRACLITLFSSGVLTIPSPLLFSYQF